MPALLSKAEIKKRLGRLHGWKNEGKFVTKTFEFEEFMDAIDFVNQIAKVAEAQEHHPDIWIRYTTVKLEIQTHSEGGVTDWDIRLAKEIEKSVKSRQAT